MIHTDLNLSVRQKFCANLAVGPESPGLRIKDDRVRLQFEHRHGTTIESHSLPCNILYIEILRVLCKLRLSPKRFAWSFSPLPSALAEVDHPGVQEPHFARLVSAQQGSYFLNPLLPELRELIYNMLLLWEVEKNCSQAISYTFPPGDPDTAKRGGPSTTWALCKGTDLLKRPPARLLPSLTLVCRQTRGRVLQQFKEIEIARGRDSVRELEAIRDALSGKAANNQSAISRESGPSRDTLRRRVA